MTIAIAWIRQLKGRGEELVFCTDSRLSGGKRFDRCSKIFGFVRTDAAICFAGATDWAYPMMVATARAAEAHFPSATRALILPKFKSHVVALLNEMRSAVHSFAQNENLPDVTFLFGGYDWISKRFRLWRIVFEPKTNVFRAHEGGGGAGFSKLGKIEIAGDADYIKDTRARLKTILQAKYGLGMNQPPQSRFDLEPFEVVRDMLRVAKSSDTIGGAPQLFKVYQHMNARHQCVFWPQKTGGSVYYCGRPLLSYENTDLWVIDPDSLVTTTIVRQPTQKKQNQNPS